jgi:cytochrome c
MTCVPGLRAIAPPGRAALLLTLALLGAPWSGGALAQPATPPAAADPGRAAFGPCRACHAIERGVNRLGPSMFGIVGRRVASEPGYEFSPAMKAFGGVWTRERLDAYLADPRTVVPNSKMSYAGIKDPARRAALIDYLATLR